ncbi:hypothetical protein HY030_02645 [Candidatus Gottesmanbacteria bacterium]|nr:hypothetical protein [Candidatus Gottesmanbacteria bacterium]
MKNRLDRVQEKRSSQKLIFSVLIGFLILIFLALWGVPSLISMSIFISNIRHRNDQIVKSVDQTPLFPPSLEPISEATNSSPILLKGYSDPYNKIELFVNGTITNDTTTDETGVFNFKAVALEIGTNSLWVRALRDDKKSDNSKILTVVYKKSAPKLEITKPEDSATITGEKKEVLVSGATDSGNAVSINNHFLIVNPDGSFFYNYPLNDGDNSLKITATDGAGNQTVIERKVKYSSS